MPAPAALAVDDEGQGQGHPLSGDGCSFGVGDTVLMSVPGTQNPSEGTVVEVDPSDGSRLKVAFRDKRKQGGWRNQSSLVSLLRSTDAGPIAGQQPRSNERPPAVDEAAARGVSDSASASATALATATAAATDTAGRRFSPRPVTLAFSHLLAKLGAQSVPFVLPAEVTGIDRDVPSPPSVVGSANERDAACVTAGAAVGAAAGPSPQASTSKVRRAATKSPVMGLQQSLPRMKGPVITTAARPVAGAAARDAAAESRVVASQPRQKRSAAAAAAAAISSTASAGKRASGGGSISSGNRATQNPTVVKKKGVKAKRGFAAPAVATKTPRKKGWRRPKIVTPGSAEGRPEDALR